MMTALFGNAQVPPTWRHNVKTALSGMMTGAIIAAPMVALLIALAPADRFDQTARAICDDAVQRAMTADTLLEFERARFVVEGIGCSRSRRIRGMYPTARAARGE